MDEARQPEDQRHVGALRIELGGERREKVAANEYETPKISARLANTDQTTTQA